MVNVKRQSNRKRCAKHRGRFRDVTLGYFGYFGSQLAGATSCACWVCLSGVMNLTPCFP